MYVLLALLPIAGGGGREADTTYRGLWFHILESVCFLNADNTSKRTFLPPNIWSNRFNKGKGICSFPKNTQISS